MGPFRGGYSEGMKRPLQKETVGRVIRIFSPYRREMILTAVAVVISAGLGLLSPFFLRIIVNQGLMKKDISIIVRFSLYSLAATISATVLSYLYSYMSIIVGQRIMRDLRNSLFDHLQGMSLRFFTSTRTGEIQSRLSNDVAGVQSVVSDTAASILSNITTVLSTLIAMFIMDWRLTVLSVGMLPVFALLSSKVGTNLRGVRSKTQAKIADLSATMQETLSVSGILLVKVSGRQSMAMNRFREENKDLTALQIRTAITMRIFFSLFRLTFSITPVFVYWLAGYLVVYRIGIPLTIGTIVAFTSLQAGLFFPVTNLLNVQVEVTSALALFDRIFEYLDLKQEITDAPGAAVLDSHQAVGDVILENVSFRYDLNSDIWALKDIEFHARPGELVALVGVSGAGKTSLAYLIPRLYDVEKGSVKIDGLDVRSVTLQSLSDVVGMVTQETYLLHDTILENLRYGKPEADIDEVEDAARAAAIHDRIMALPEGYNTVVGERGYKLSGGEKQRIAIARALLKNPRILILDEATASLDTQSERQIQSALNLLMSGRTTIAIAHRLSTILSANQILALENGRIVERGTHKQLIELGGQYANLYAAQFTHDDQTSQEDSEPASQIALTIRE